VSSGRRTKAAFVAIAVLAAAIGITTYATDLFRGVELDTMDTRFSIRGTQPPPDEVVVVEIDDVSFSDLDEQWPFPRSLHGELIDRLTEAGARAIAYDVQFTEPTSRVEDNALIRAAARAGNVVLATTEVDQRGRSNVFGGEEVLRSVNARAANTLIPSDPGGVVRRIEHQVQGLESFAAATAEVATGAQVDPSQFDGDAWIDYHGPPGTIPTVSFSKVVGGKVDPAFFEDKIVVVGVSAPTLQDVHPTPITDGQMAGAEVQANAIATVLDGFPLSSAPGALDIAIIVLVALVGPLAGAGRRPLLAFAVALAVGGLYLVAAQLAFNGGVVLPVIYPLVALAVGAVGTLALHYLFAAFDRQRVRDTFARFVPANVVDQVLAQTGAELRLGGVRRECTVLFSDIRGFTSYSESRPPDEVVEVLNRYLGQMTDAIMDHGGTLVAYMGDGIMAVFGAPIEQPDHADRALAAAREMLDVRLPAFCEWMREAGRGEGFRMGIGLNSGEVMSGQVGSVRRMEYTTIGDTVNTASRLEGMTKGTEHQLFIADSTRRALTREVPDLIHVGDFPVRGREREIGVWSLTSTAAPSTAGASAAAEPVGTARGAE
jgi:adenylate cyclase